MQDCLSRERAPGIPARRLLPGRPRPGRARPAALLGRPRHERDAALDPAAVRSRGRHPHRRARPARRELGGDHRQGPGPGGDRDAGGRRPRGVRRRVRGAGDPRQRPLRRRLPAVHGAGPAADRPDRRRGGARARLRHDRARLHRQGQRSGPDRLRDRDAGAGAARPRAGSRMDDGEGGGDRLRARAPDPDLGWNRAAAVLDRRQPLGTLLGGPGHRGHRPTAARRRLPARHPARGGARRARADPDRLRGRAPGLARRRSTSTSSI